MLTLMLRRQARDCVNLDVGRQARDCVNLDVGRQARDCTSSVGVNRILLAKYDYIFYKQEVALSSRISSISIAAAV